MTPREEMKALLEKVSEMALDEIDKLGWHHPVCCANSPGGDPFIFVSGKVEDGDLVDDGNPQPAAEHASITHQLRKFIAEGKLQSVALARNVNIRIEPDAGGEPERATAIQILIDHRDAVGYAAYLVYCMQDGKAVPKTIHYEELADRFFPEPV